MNARKKSSPSAPSKSTLSRFRSQKRFGKSGLLAGLLPGLVLATTSPAADIVWTGGGVGSSFSDPVNWSPAVVPGLLDTSLFDIIGGAVNFSTGALNLGLTVNNAPVTLHLPTGLLQDYTVSGQMVVGAAFGDIASLTLLDGTLIVQDTLLVSDIHIGFAAGSVGNVTSSAGAIFNSQGGMKVGEFGSGGIDIINGGKVQSQVTFAGENPGSMGSILIAGAGSNWTSTLGDAFIGNFGNGTLTMNLGGIMTVPVLFVADDPGSVSSATVDGLGTTLNATTKIFVGNGGTGTLDITNQGVVNATNFNAGDDPFSLGTITVSGPGSRLDVTLSTDLGSDGTGIMNVINGGAVTTLNAFIGRRIISTNSQANIDGIGSSWTIGADLKVADKAPGTLNITNGASVSAATAFISNRDVAVAVVNISGPGSLFTVTTNAAIGNDGPGTMSISGGGNATTATVAVGDNPGAIGVVLVQNPGSSWNSAGSAFVGNFGNGTATITNGGTANFNALFIGDDLGSTGTVSVDGPTATLNYTGAITVGNNGNGVMNVINGGTVSGTGLVFVGDDPTGNGTLDVNGLGSTLSAGLEMSVGNLGPGSVLVTNSGSITTNGVKIGDGSVLGNGNSNGVVTVTGPTATWTDTLNFIVGNFATGTLNINGAGTLNGVQGTIGDDPGGRGVVNVDGVGSDWNNSLSLILGNLGFGTLNLTGGGQASAPQIILGFSGATAFGDAVITGSGSTLSATLGLTNGFLGGGSIRLLDNGRTSVTGSYDQSTSGMLEVILGPTTLGGVNATVAANLGGILKLNLAAAFSPPLGTQFTIVTAPVINGTFATVAAPQGLSVTYNSTSVVITVTGPIVPRCLADCAPVNLDGSVGNGVVNIDDLISTLSAFGATGGLCDITPVNANGTLGNGAVNIDDLVALLSAFGTCP